jgi:hypothetical protein
MSFTVCIDVEYADRSRLIMSALDFNDFAVQLCIIKLRVMYLNEKVGTPPCRRHSEVYSGVRCTILITVCETIPSSRLVPFGLDTPRMRSKRPSAGGATNLPRARCIGTKSSTRDRMVGVGSRAARAQPQREASKTLQSYRPSSYWAIQRLYLGKNLNSRKKRETGRQKKKFPTKSSRLSGYRNLIPA